MQIFVSNCNDAYEAGKNYGEKAKTLISKWISLPRTQKLFERLDIARIDKIRATCESRYPEIYEELLGLAEGSKRTIREILILNLLQEFDDIDHCTSVTSPVGELLAHNEDWDTEIGAYCSLVIYSGTYRCVAGLCYPGMIPGSAIAWNERFVMTQNAIDSFEVIMPIVCPFRFLLTRTNLYDMVLPDDFGIGVSLHVVDMQTWAGFTIETKPSGSVRVAHNMRRAHTNNFLLDEEVPSFVNDPRYHRAMTLLNQHQTALTIISDTEGLFPIYSERTIVSIVAMDTGKLVVWDKCPNAAPFMLWNFKRTWTENISELVST
jgi:hypothetical protein